MRRVHRIIQLILHDRNRIVVALYNKAVKRGLTNFLGDRLFIKITFKIKLNKKIDLDNPRTFCEKLQWLKLNDRNPYYSKLVDKYEVKSYVSNIIGAEYIIPTIGVWNNFDDIDISKLPEQFVLKCTHDSHSVAVCRDKKTFDWNMTRSKIEYGLKHNLFYWGREWPYKNVKPRIIAEKYMEDSQSKDLRDYKFYCFNGEPLFCQVISDRTSNETIDFYDMKWRHLEFTGLELPRKPFGSTQVNKPKTFEKMKQFAKLLSRSMAFVRVDFYEVNGKLYFGELTFYPAAGFGAFYPEKYNTIIGNLLQLP